MTSLADKAYHEIRGLIVSLELAPGALIDERELIGRLEIGRTPVREALRRLAHERLVEVYPRRGMFVTGVDVRELARLSEVRELLEPEAARLAAERATDADRDQLAALLAELEAGRSELMDLDERIHRAIYRASHNRFLEETLEEYYTLALRIWVTAVHQTGQLHAAVLEHRKLLQSIVAGNGENAALIMRVHVDEFEQTMRDALLQP